jgi:sugar lactone lactonase YvrE
VIRAAARAAGTDFSGGISQLKFGKPGAKSPGFLFPVGRATNGKGRGFLRSTYSNVDERPSLGTFAGTSTTHTMTNTIFFRPLLAAAALVALLFGAAPARAATGDILETNEGNILRFRTLGGTPTTFAAGFTNPKGIVFDGNGHVYVADAGKNAIILLTVPDGSGSTFLAGLNAPTGVALDTAANLYVSEAGSGNILKFAVSDKSKTTFASNVGASAGLAFDNSGNLYAADFNGGKINKFTPDGTQSTFATGLNHPAGLAVDSSGNVFEADSGSGTIFKFAPDGTKTSFATGLGRPYGLAIDSNGNLCVCDNDNGSTLRYSPDGVKSVIFQSDFNTPQFLAVEPAQHQLLNISTRGLVQGGDNVLIAGFVVGGNGPVGTSVLVRALGPSLSAFGISNPLPNPVIELRDASGTLIASNNDWKDTQQTAISGTTLQPTDDRESAILTSLHGGSFTAIVGTATGETGTAVVEVYNLQ